MKLFFRRNNIFTIYSTETCSYCKKAKDLLSSKDINYIEILLRSADDLNQLSTKMGYTPKTVPQIWRDNTHVGGYDNLVEYFNERGAVA